jgi:glucose-6-phosphate 1-dehydrogenase
MSRHAAIDEQGRPGDSCVLVIFGVSGDLTKRKLLPSLYNLARKKLLPSNFALVGLAIDQISEDAFREQVRKDLHEFAAAPDECDFCDWLIERLYYISAGLHAHEGSARQHRSETRNGR